MIFELCKSGIKVRGSSDVADSKYIKKNGHTVKNKQHPVINFVPSKTGGYSTFK